jgi:hypothetical protein
VAVADREPPRLATGGQLLNSSTPIAEASLRGLHSRSIEDSAEIYRLLKNAPAKITACFTMALTHRSTWKPRHSTGGRILVPGLREMPRFRQYLIQLDDKGIACGLQG